MIALDKVSRSYATPFGRVDAVREASAEMGSGEMVCLMGPSGSGKSTLLNLISGIDVPDDGCVMVDDLQVNKLGEEARAKFRLEHVAAVFQDDNLIAEFRAVENVELPLLARGVSRGEARERSVAAMAEVGIAELEQRWPGQMSGGQRQRVGIARALAGALPVLVADEPTGALDTENSDALFLNLAGLAHDHGMCVVVATHDQAATKVADRVLTIRDGRIEP
ncbi:ABC transporter ATP-binding protein [Parenemella sanctibonifatiensis]|uniref:ABC transporter ATP-binding protein n=1 Tax=Parenemella sanctibonifatiensis TaxID=2016505 RepID=A0A255EKP2_9ACTN|nr:ABC transporter ATP-binding protein [Parenemella sanctibonifatiensis]OYN92086.1 ABC transporter ATP-binding protein [Parenemella sanctibonifatiensis]